MNIILRRSHFLLIVMLVLTCCSSKHYAIATVEDYLAAIRDGKDTLDYKRAGVDDLINVFDYKYVRTIREYRIPIFFSNTRKDFELSKEAQRKNSWDNRYVYMDKWKTFDDYVNWELKVAKIVGGHVTVTQDTLNDEKNGGFRIRPSSIMIVEPDSAICYDVLFDVTLANRIGMKLYKKLVFVVESRTSKGKDFEITNYWER